MSGEDLSALEARRIAIASQSFLTRRPTTVTAATIRALVARLGAIQIDSVNVLSRSHFLPVFSRLGPYDRTLLENIPYRKRKLFEYWAHEASLLPSESYPLLHWRMERARRGKGMWGGIARAGRDLRKRVAEVRRTIETEGPMAASDFREPRNAPSWWGWSETKTVLEYLFWCGEITAKTRRSTFERVYDLTERVLPASILNAPRPDEAGAQRELVKTAARAFGVATLGDLRDYFRLELKDAAARVAELVESGDLRPIRVKGWKQQAYLYAGAPHPRKADRSALLSPFDSLVWNRDRTQRLFGFTYRIEIYTPAHKRVHGYYVLPYLLGDDLVARADLKADRQAGKLLVHAWHFEPGADKRLVVPRLREDLERLARWLGLNGATYPK